MNTVIDLAWATTHNAGPKLARLGQLIHHDIRIPQGFVVTSTAYESGADRVDAEIAVAYQRLCSGVDKAVVVRSSATDEDGSAASFAGVYDSYLGVRGADDVIRAVHDCRAGLHTAKAVAYRQRMGCGEAAPAMAVGVMLMVAARASGVAFTVDPVTGRDDKLVIEASWGFGEPVVQGVVTPDRIEVAEDGRVLRYRTGDKRTMLHYDETRGMEYVEMPLDLARVPALTDGAVSALTEAVRAVAAMAGEPVDCEWVLDDDGAVWIVQWRSVTALPVAEAPLWDPAEYAARYAFRSA